jgi:hypothetical protein
MEDNDDSQSSSQQIGQLSSSLEGAQSSTSQQLGKMYSSQKVAQSSSSEQVVKPKVSKKVYVIWAKKVLGITLDW